MFGPTDEFDKNREYGLHMLQVQHHPHLTVSNKRMFISKAYNDLHMKLLLCFACLYAPETSHADRSTLCMIFV